MSERLGSWRYAVACGGGIAFSLLTGINLGLHPSIRNVGGDAGSLVSRSAGLTLLVFSLTVLFVGPFFTALAQ